MSVPYRYVKGVAIGRDDTCNLCHTRSTSLVIDHCHAHGYARGMLCARCNGRAARLDAGTLSPTAQEAFYLANCPDCRRSESIDSPDAHALRIGAVVLAISKQLALTPRQAAALARSLLDEDAREDQQDTSPRQQTSEPSTEDLVAMSKADAIRVALGEAGEVAAAVHWLSGRGVTVNCAYAHRVAKELLPQADPLAADVLPFVDVDPAS